MDGKSASKQRVGRISDLNEGLGDLGCGRGIKLMDRSTSLDSELLKEVIKEFQRGFGCLRLFVVRGVAEDTAMRLELLEPDEGTLKSGS